MNLVALSPARIAGIASMLLGWLLRPPKRSSISISRKLLWEVLVVVLLQ